MSITKFLLDSGDPEEYKEISALAKKHGSEIWGVTTNPSLIAKKLAGPSTELIPSGVEGLRVNKQITQKEAFELQKQIVLEITNIVPGAVSVEVYADQTTSAEDMIEQGREIASWRDRVVVKIPTTVEGFRARTALRKEGIITNNTLVFSQQQIFAICLHEEIMQNAYGIKNKICPPFISPFVGRLDDQMEDGMSLVQNGMQIKQDVGADLWMLEASVRNLSHIKRGLAAGTELITAPAKVYHEWFSLSNEQIEELDATSYTQRLNTTELWEAPEELILISSIEEFMGAVESGMLDINHPLTTKGIEKFVADWQAILTT